MLNFLHKPRVANTTIINVETQDFIRIKEHREFIIKYPCPNCNKLKLHLVKHEQGRNGWETQIICDSCRSTGIMNSTGIEFNLSGIPEKEVGKK